MISYCTCVCAVVANRVCAYNFTFPNKVQTGKTKDVSYFIQRVVSYTLVKVQEPGGLMVQTAWWAPVPSARWQQAVVLYGPFSN